MNLKINDRIRVRNIEFFNNFGLELRHDAVASTFGFALYFDPNNPDHRELACVSHYHEAVIEHNGEKLVTGYILSQGFGSGPKTELMTISGYSKTGVLEDCQIPTSVYPLQSDGLNLREIAQKFIAPFKLKMVIDPSVRQRMEIPYTTTTAEVTQTIKTYLTELATQRNIIISHDINGDLLFTQANASAQPIAHFEHGLMGANMGLTFSGQPLHSDITVVKQADSNGGNAGEYTVKNPYVPIVYRPKVLVQSSGDEERLGSGTQEHKTDNRYRQMGR
jgi:prophage tail gpP-like protein